MARARTDLPHNAVKINGVFLEDVVTGFTTLRASGREYVDKYFTLYDVTKNDGVKLNYSRYPEKEITVEFVLGTNNYNDYASCHETLMKYLDVNEAEIIFNDEPDKYYIGSLSIASIDKQTTFCTGKYTILCTDPFKYDVNETTVTSSTVTVDGIQVTALTTNNTGGYKTFPEFEVQFAEDISSGDIGTAGDCGYVLFSKDDYSLQFGDDEEKDTQPVVISTDFSTATKGVDWDDNTTLPLPAWSPYMRPTAQGTIKFMPSGGGMRVNGYGTTRSSQFYGPMGAHTLATSATGDFELSWKQLWALSSVKTTGIGQGGMMLVILYDSSNQPAYAFGVKKANKTKLTGEVIYFDSDGLKTLKSGQDLSYTNPLGYKVVGATNARYATNTIKRTQRDGLTYINIDSAVGAYEFVYEDCPAISKIGFYIAKFSSLTAPTIQAFKTCTFNGGDIDLINTFSSGDLLEVNCNDASVKLNDKDEPSLGDISNDWSNFYLDRGTNNIYVQWSDWVTQSPTVTMKYRKRWL